MPSAMKKKQTTSFDAEASPNDMVAKMPEVLRAVAKRSACCTAMRSCWQQRRRPPSYSTARRSGERDERSDLRWDGGQRTRGDGDNVHAVREALARRTAVAGRDAVCLVSLQMMGQVLGP